MLVGGVHESATEPDDGDALLIIGADGGPAGVAESARNALEPEAAVEAIRKL